MLMAFGYYSVLCMVKKFYTRRTALKRLGASLTASVLLSGGAAGSAAAVDTREGIIPPQGQDNGWSVSRSGRPIPRFPSVGDDGTRYQVKAPDDPALAGWTKYTSDRRFPPTTGPGKRLRFDQTTSLGREEAALWLTETDADADAEVIQTAAIAAPFHIELREKEDRSPAILSATTVGSYAGAIQVTQKNEQNPKITSVDVTLSVGIIQLDMLDQGESLPGVDSVRALSEDDLVSLTVTPPTDPSGSPRTEELTEPTATGTVTARLVGSGKYAVYWNVTARTDTEHESHETAKISFSQDGPDIGDIDPEVRGIRLDEVTIELQELGE